MALDYTPPARDLSGALNVRSLGATGNTLSYADGVATGAAFSSASASFTDGDVGKSIRIMGAGDAGGSFITTIAAFVNANAVTLAGAVTTNVAAARFWYGTDDTTAIVNAIATAQTRKKALYFPSAAYWMVSHSSSITLNNAALLGDGQKAVNQNAPAGGFAAAGSVILIENTTTAPFTPQAGNVIDGLTFFWPAQDGSASTPIAYPALFQSNVITNLVLNDLCVVNAYQLIKVPNSVATSGFGRISISGIRAYVIDKVFYFLNGGADIVQLDASCIFSPGIYAGIATSGNQYLAKYTNENGVFLHVDVGAGTYTRVDGFRMDGCFLYGFRYGVLIDSGLMDLATFADVTWDAIPTVLRINGSGQIFHSTLTGGSVYSTQTFGVSPAATAFNALHFTGNSNVGDLAVSGVNFAYCKAHFVFFDDLSIGQLSVTGCHFENWGQSTTPATYYALVLVDAGARMTVSGNVFRMKSWPHTHNGILVTNPYATTIVGNTFSQCDIPITASGNAGFVVLSGNATNGTIGIKSFNDATTGSALVYDYGNLWDVNRGSQLPFQRTAASVDQFLMMGA